MGEDVKWKVEGDTTKMNLSFCGLTCEEFFDTMCDLLKTVGSQREVKIDIAFEMRKITSTSEKDETNG